MRKLAASCLWVLVASVLWGPLAGFLPGQEGYVSYDRPVVGPPRSNRGATSNGARQAQVATPETTAALGEAESPEWEEGDVSWTEGPAEYHGCDAGCSDCLPRACPTRGAWIGGAEWLHVRPSFSEAVAYVQSTFQGQDLTQTRHEYDFGYDSSVRASLGYRRCDCNGQFLFTYMHMEGTASAATPLASGSTLYTGPLEINASPGQGLWSGANVELDTYDLDFAKAFPSVSGGCGAGACDASGACPPWDVIWSAGVRLAAVDSQYGGQILDDERFEVARSQTDITFRGAGPRLGILGRRYFGRARCCSLFVQGNASLLLGDYDIRSDRIVRSPTESRQTEVSSLTRVVPVTEIEAGGTWRVGRHTLLSAGYLLHVWYDLGITQGIGGNLPSADTANILSFDGLFVRGEWAF